MLDPTKAVESLLLPTAPANNYLLTTTLSQVLWLVKLLTASLYLVTHIPSFRDSNLSQSQNQHGDRWKGDQKRQDVEHEWEGRARAAESNLRVDHRPRKVIPYKEYVAHQEKASTVSKPTLEDKENWDEEPPLPHWETSPGVRPMLPSQEDEWKLMVDQDPHSRSAAGDLGHGTMVMTSEAEPIGSNRELIRAMGGINEDASTGINENVLAGYLSDVEWKEEDPLIQINDENVTISQMPAAALTPI